MITRTCSYCRNYGHNIRHCNDPTIDIAIADMREKFVVNIVNTDNEGYTSSRIRFTTWLDRKYMNPVIRAVIYRLNIGNSSDTKYTGIEKIIEYFTNEYNISHNQGWYYDRTPSRTINTTTTIYTRAQSRHVNTSPSVNTRVENHRTAPIVTFLQSYPLEGVGWVTTYNRYDYNTTTATTHTTNLYALAPVRSSSIIQMKLLDKNIDTAENFDCPICLGCIDNSQCVTLNCSHKFCSTCVSELVKTSPQTISCSLCRTTVTNMEVSSNSSCEKLKVYGDRIHQVC